MSGSDSRPGWIRRRSRAARDDRGSMAMLLLISLIGVMLSALLIPMIITQDQSTKFTTTRQHSLDAARAGLDAMLGRIRAAVDGAKGDTRALPCGPIAGKVSGPGAAAYTADIKYYTSDPVLASAPLMKCVTGYGTFEPVSGAFTPSYAQVTSTGTDGPVTGTDDRPANGSSAGRTLISTYVFKTSNTNIAGGTIRLYPAAAVPPAAPQLLCMDAGSASPASGTPVRLQTCSTTSPPAPQQVLVYRSDLTLQLRSSSTGATDGMCLGTTASAAGNALVLQNCQPLGDPPYTQQWSFDDNGRYRATLSGGGLAPSCINAASQTVGLGITLAACVGSTTSPSQAWIPSPLLGAGASAPPQWVNFYEFGRCMDVTDQNVDTDHLIDFPCKQDPNPANVAWNQKFTTPTTAAGAGKTSGQIYTTVNSVRYCLTTPAAIDGYVTMTVCGSVVVDRQKWTVATGDKALPYAAKYTTVDYLGRCLGLTAPKAAEQWSGIVAEQCTGAAEQKWNAQANLSTPTLQNVREE